MGFYLFYGWCVFLTKGKKAQTKRQRVLAFVRFLQQIFFMIHINLHPYIFSHILYYRKELLA